MNGEIWKDVKGYEGLYQVSNLGRVKSLDHYASNGETEILYKGKVRTQHIHNEYLTVSLSKGDVATHHLVHRLVAKAFIPNPDNKSVVNHIDGNKTNNNADNLEWTSQKYNVIHSVRMGLRRLKVPQDKFSYIRDEHKRGRSLRDIAQEFGVGKTRIFQIVRCSDE